MNNLSPPRRPYGATPALSRARAAPATQLTAAQHAVVQQITTATRQLPTPMYFRPLRPLLRWVVQPVTAKLGMQYPLDVRVMQPPARVGAVPQQPIVLIGAGHLWALRAPVIASCATAIATAFPHLGIPTANFRAYPPVVRQILYGASQVWYGGIWEGKFQTGPNPMIRRVRAERRTELPKILELEPARPLSRRDRRVALAALPLLGVLVASSVGLLPGWLLAAQFGLAFLSLWPRHGSSIKTALHVLGDTLLHRSARGVTDRIDQQVRSVRHDVPPAFLMGNLCYLGVVEMLEARGYQTIVE